MIFYVESLFLKTKMEVERRETSEREREQRRQSQEREKKIGKNVIFFRVWGIYTPTRSGVRVSIAAHRAPSLLSL
jgi:hypothetical protein